MQKFFNDHYTSREMAKITDIPHKVIIGHIRIQIKQCNFLGFGVIKKHKNSHLLLNYKHFLVLMMILYNRENCQKAYDIIDECFFQNVIKDRVTWMEAVEGTSEAKNFLKALPDQEFAIEMIATFLKQQLNTNMN